MLNNMLAGAFAGSEKATVNMEGDSVASAELWLRQLYGKLVDESYAISIEDIWLAIHFSRKTFLPLEKLNDWFAELLKRNKGGEDMKGFELDELQELLYPCQEFDHPKGFAHATRRLAYEMAGHITEHNPTRYGALHIRPQIISMPGILIP